MTKRETPSRRRTRRTRQATAHYTDTNPSLFSSTTSWHETLSKRSPSQHLPFPLTPRSNAKRKSKPKKNSSDSNKTPTNSNMMTIGSNCNSKSKEEENIYDEEKGISKSNRENSHSATGEINNNDHDVGSNFKDGGNGGNSKIDKHEVEDKGVLISHRTVNNRTLSFFSQQNSNSKENSTSITTKMKSKSINNYNTSYRQSEASIAEAFLKRHHGLNIHERGNRLFPQWKEMRYNNFYHDQEYRTVEIQENILLDNDDDYKSNKFARTNSNNKFLDESKINDESETNTKESIVQSLETNYEMSKPIRRCILVPPNANLSNTANPASSTSKNMIKKKEKNRNILTSYVTRTCSCMAISPSPNDYLAIGDTAGYVTIYSLSAITTAMIRISTKSSLRAYQEEKETRNREKIGINKASNYRNQKQSKVNTSNNNSTTASSPTEELLKQYFSHHPSTKGSERNLSSAAIHVHAIEAIAFSSFPISNPENSFSSIKNCTYDTENLSSKSFLLVLSTKMDIEVHNICLQSRNTQQSKTQDRNENGKNNCNNWLNDTLLWSINTAQQWLSGPAMRLSVHPLRGILASFFQAYPISDEEIDDKKYSPVSSRRRPNNFSPLCLCQKDKSMTAIIPTICSNSNSNGLISSQGINSMSQDSQQIELGTHAIGIWDIQSYGSYIFFSSIIQSKSKSNIIQTHQILKIDSETHDICHRAIIPMKGSKTKNVSPDALCLSPEGTYVLVTSLKGIRLYTSQNLQLIKIIGESIALHGHVIIWQDCFMLMDHDEKNKYDLECKMNKKYEGRTKLHLESKSNNTSGTFDSAQSVTSNTKVTNENMKIYIVGIPHAFREPQEMKDVIYFWEIKDFQFEEKKLPTFTIKCPKNSKSIHSIIWRNSKLILMTQLGNCYELVESFYSDWSGKMYPPGYLVHEENIYYIENEDELDIVEEDLDADAKNFVSNDFERNACDEVWEDYSLFQNEQDSYIDVVGEENKELVTIPSHPESFLQHDMYAQLIDNQPARKSILSPLLSDDVTNGSKSNANFVFSLLPTISDMSQLREKGLNHHLKEENLSVELERSKSNRSRRSIEVTLKASIDKHLRQKMLRRQCWSPGNGSSINGNNKIQCQACSGRMSIHTCGSLSVPEDQELIKQALEELNRKKIMEKEEKKRLLKEKMRLDRLKRKEEKKKVEEERKKAELELKLEKEAEEKEMKEKERKRKKMEEEEKRKIKKALEEERQMKKTLEDERKKRRKLEDEERKLRKKQEKEEKQLRKKVIEEERRLRKIRDEERKVRKKQEDERRQLLKQMIKLEKEEKRAAKRKAVEDKKLAIKEAKAYKALLKMNCIKPKKRTKPMVGFRERKSIQGPNEVQLASLIAAFVQGNVLEISNNKMSNSEAFECKGATAKVETNNMTHKRQTSLPSFGTTFETFSRDEFIDVRVQQKFDNCSNQEEYFSNGNCYENSTNFPSSFDASNLSILAGKQKMENNLARKKNNNRSNYIPKLNWHQQAQDPVQMLINLHNKPPEIRIEDIQGESDEQIFPYFNDIKSQTSNMQNQSHNKMIKPIIAAAKATYTCSVSSQHVGNAQSSNHEIFHMQSSTSNSANDRLQSPKYDFSNNDSSQLQRENKFFSKNNVGSYPRTKMIYSNNNNFHQSVENYGHQRALQNNTHNSHSDYISNSLSSSQVHNNVTNTRMTSTQPYQNNMSASAFNPQMTTYAIGNNQNDQQCQIPYLASNSQNFHPSTEFLKSINYNTLTKNKNQGYHTQVSTYNLFQHEGHNPPTNLASSSGKECGNNRKLQKESEKQVAEDMAAVLTSMRKQH